MRKQLPTQLIVGLGILIVGGGIVGGEYYLVKWYPRHAEAVKAATLRAVPYKNDSLGIEMQVAAGFDKKVESFAGGVRIYAPKFWSIGPSITLTAQPNPDQTVEFTPQVLAKWQTLGVTEDIPRYHFERTRLNNRDAVLIWQYKARAMLLTARIISPDRIVEADCTPGRADEDLYMEACDQSLRTIKVAGPESPPSASPGVLELTPVPRTAKP
jgi:hypothetical protein